MSKPAVPAYLGDNFKDASPGMRFGMYLKLWGEDEKTGALSWSTSDTIYRLRGRDRRERRISQDNKRPAINAACQLDPTAKALMQAVAERQNALSRVVDDESLTVFDARAIAPFTTGLGNEHPLENGFAFLWPYGLPYLPGSGIKGVLRQAARELASGEWEDSRGWDDDKRYAVKPGKQPPSLSMVDILFGLESKDTGKEHFRGVLSFWDVVPLIKSDRLMVEIMTAHQTHYYQKGDTPHDSGSPNPIPFLTVPPGSGFTFHVVCDLPRLRRVAPTLAESERWKDSLLAAFEHAFDWLGFGAKTAVGYGAMAIDESAQALRKAREKAAAIASLSPEERLIANLREIFRDEVNRGILSASSQTSEKRLELLHAALEWKDDNLRKDAAGLIQETLKKTPWSKKQKKRGIAEMLKTLEGNS